MPLSSPVLGSLGQRAGGALWVGNGRAGSAQCWSLRPAPCRPSPSAGVLHPQGVPVLPIARCCSGGAAELGALEEVLRAGRAHTSPTALLGSLFGDAVTQELHSVVPTGPFCLGVLVVLSYRLRGGAQAAVWLPPFVGRVWGARLPTSASVTLPPSPPPCRVKGRSPGPHPERQEIRRPRKAQNPPAAVVQPREEDLPESASRCEYGGGGSGGARECECWGCCTPQLGDRRGNERSAVGRTGCRKPIGAPSSLDRGKEGSAHVGEARGGTDPPAFACRGDHGLSHESGQQRFPAQTSTSGHAPRSHALHSPAMSSARGPPGSCRGSGHALLFFFPPPPLFLGFTPLPSPLALGFQATTKEVKESLGKQWSQLSDKKRLKWIHKALEQRKEYEVGSSLTPTPPYCPRHHSARPSSRPGSQVGFSQVPSESPASSSAAWGRRSAPG